jgi:hypothetical protein
MVQDGSQIIDRAGRFVVDDRHPIAAGQKRLDEMAADETGPARYDTIFHGNQR